MPTSDLPSGLDDEVAEPIPDQSEADVSLGEEVDEPISTEREEDVISEEEVEEADEEEPDEPAVTNEVEYHGDKAELSFQAEYVFINGKRIDVTDVAADVMRFMVVVGQSHNITFEQLLNWLVPVHPRLDVEVLNIVIDGLSKPQWFPNNSALVKIGQIDSINGKRRVLNLGEGFTHRHLEAKEMQSLLDKFMPKG